MTGENGILTQASTAREENQKASILEQAKLDVLSWQAEQIGNGQNSELTDSKVKEILTGKDYLKDGTLDNEGFKNKEGDIVFKYSELYKPSQTKTPVTFNPETFELGTAINSGKYGWKVNGYTVKTDEFTTGVWRLFYQDRNYTYLITDECIGRYVPSDYYNTVTNSDENLKYQTGADVGIVGQKLNKMLLDEGTFFVEENTNTNIRATAWFTDIEADIWKQYKNEDAVFAIGGATAELYKASFDATASENGATIFDLGVGEFGYTVGMGVDHLDSSDNYGIYHKDLESHWWLTSPYDYRGITVMYVHSFNRFIGNNYVDGGMSSVRPIVCIPTDIFDDNYASTLVNE